MNQNPMNRRDFLRALSIAAAGIVVPDIEPRRKIWQVPQSAPVRALGFHADLPVIDVRRALRSPPVAVFSTRRSAPAHAWARPLGVKVSSEQRELLRQVLDSFRSDRAILTLPVGVGIELIDESPPASRNSELDDAIDRWHDSRDDRTLADALRMSPESFERWVERG